ncbi:MAG TPA: hypothetical protein DCW60_04125, partial [Sutterella sp.]|nr:hypothetical protein [Sutterella sp.]
PTTAPADFFSVYGKRLIIDNADIAPEIMDFVPTDARVVLIGNFKGSDKARLAGRDAKTFTLMPLSFKETRGANPKPFAKDPVPLKITYPAP